MSGVRILIADDHAIVRSGLRLILEGHEDMEVVGEAADGAAAIAEVERCHPDVVLLDISMVGMNGLEAARTIRARNPGVRILVLTMYDDAAYLQRALELGVEGYLLKRSADTELIAAVRTIIRGAPFVDRSLTHHLIDLYLKRSDAVTVAAGPEHALSPRESEVLRLVAHGYSGQEIAERLGISASTVETHRAHVAEKLGIKGRAQLVRYALTHGLMDEAERS